MTNTIEEYDATFEQAQDTIDIRVAKAVGQAMKLSEVIFGYIPYSLTFIRATYKGKTLFPSKITPIEKAIVGILNVDGTSSFEDIGRILGLDVSDKAESAILDLALENLRGFNAVEGDDSCIKLTEDGRVYAANGERRDSYSRTFDILVDKQHPTWLNIKNCIGKSADAIENGAPCEDLDLGLEQIKAYAEYQAHDVHYPKDRYILEEAVWQEGHEATYKVYVCFVQNVSDKEVRAFVYDDNYNGLNELIAEQINKDEDLLGELFSKCVGSVCEKDEETKLLKSKKEVEKAKAEMPEELKEAERQMIKEEEEAEKIKKGKTTKKKTSSRTLDNDRLHKKALYDTLSFEVELQNIFKYDNPDEIWMISPWVKGAFLRDRLPLIEKFLKDKKKNVFIAYSEPSKNEVEETMIPIDIKLKVNSFENSHSNFFFVQLPEFHLKNVIEKKGEQIIVFSGSFNPLSFSVAGKNTNVRKEQMLLLHHQIVKSEYQNSLLNFAKVYVNRIKKQVDALSDLNVSKYDDGKLMYFLSADDPKIRNMFLPIYDDLERKKISGTRHTLRNELNTINQKLIISLNRSGINPKEKKNTEESLMDIEKKMEINGIDDPSILALLENNREILGKIPIDKNAPLLDKDAPHRGNVLDLLKEKPKATVEGLALYIAKLEEAWFNQEFDDFTKLNLLDDKFLEIIRDESLLNLFELIMVTEVLNDDTHKKFNLWLGIKGYSFVFLRMHDKEEFISCMRSSVKRFPRVTKENIKDVLAELSKR